MALLVLHLSDLHFGPHSRFEGHEPSALGKRFCAELRRALALHDRSAPDLVLVTGDLTEGARQREFETAQHFFDALVASLGLERARFCFVPGNHDVSWAHCKRVRVDQEIEEFDDTELERRLQREKMASWDHFLAQFHGEGGTSERRELSPGASVQDFPELRVSVAALDSCRRESDQIHGGFVGEAQAAALMSEWHREQRRHWLKLIAVHHNPVADNEDNLREWVGWLGEQAESKALSRNAILHFAADATGFEGKSRLHAVAEDTQAQLVLHGHVHAAGHTPWSWRRGVKGQTQVVGAGSWGLSEHKLPGEQPVMFQLLNLDPVARELRIQRRVWEPRARAPGEVSAGSFVEDPAAPAGGLVLDIGLPEGFELPTAESSAREPSRPDRSFLDEYRMRLRGRHRTWELGAVHMGARRPATPALDDMYVPLRLGPRRERELNDQSQGEVVTPYRILQRHRNLLIRGAAGSGKTTWMRWSFRRLLERDDALPILIELRELARQWSLPGTTGKQRNFDWWLEQWVERFVGRGWSEALRTALNSSGGPRPVLMVDGWDELGDLGREFREQFDGFLAAHPRVLAIATSRPYGEQVPEYDARFETVEVLPLSDPEMGTLVELFFAKVHEGSEAEVAEDVARFTAALGAAEQAKSLGRTPLLLVMMLIIGRGRPLPDRRHKLYEFCIEQLLDAHPSKRVQDGVQVASWQWAPEGFEPRLRAVAKLALWMHQNHDASQGGRAAVAQREALAAQLPADWSGTHKHGFLAWLVASSGLMVDFSDEALSFAHLGFQEYLAAWQLEVDCEGARARIELCAELSADDGWWETLRLWAALVEGRASERLEPVLHALAGDKVGYWLAGSIFADGLGSASFEAWLARLPKASFGSWSYGSATTAADAWNTSRQLPRRRAIAQAIREQVPHSNWLDWWRWQRWWKRAGLEGGIGWPPAHTLAGTILRSTEKLAEDPAAVAWGRVWMASSPLWCGKHVPLLALRLWPNRRMWTGMMLQMEVAAGGEAPLEHRAAKLWTQLRQPAFGSESLRAMTIDYLEQLREQSLLEREGKLVLEQARYVASFDVFEVFTGARGLVRPVTLAHELGDAHRAANALARQAANRTTYWTSDWPNASSTQVCDWTLGFVGVRSVFAAAEDDDPLVQLMAAACRLSLSNGRPDSAFERRCAGFEGDPLWPALARHLARASSAADRSLLEDLARHPEQREGLLGHGLRYWVRGDVMLADGEILELEDLGQELAMLDALAPELEIELDR